MWIGRVKYMGGEARAESPCVQVVRRDMYGMIKPASRERYRIHRIKMKAPLLTAVLKRFLNLHQRTEVQKSKQVPWSVITPSQFSQGPQMGRDPLLLCMRNLRVSSCQQEWGRTGSQITEEFPSFLWRNPQPLGWPQWSVILGLSLVVHDHWRESKKNNDSTCDRVQKMWPCAKNVVHGSGRDS